MAAVTVVGLLLEVLAAVTVAAPLPVPAAVTAVTLLLAPAAAREAAVEAGCSDSADEEECCRHYYRYLSESAEVAA